VADATKFGDKGNGGTPDDKPLIVNCAMCEAQLMDSLDGLLGDREQAAFDAHLQHCQACTRMVTDAKRGAAWLEMLRDAPPEPPAALLERILAETSGAAANAPVMAGMVAIGAQRGNVLPFRRKGASGWNLASAMRTLTQPRLAMTAAMAFFSIALTLSLTGIHPSNLRMSDLKPSSLKHSFYQANSHVVRYYYSLRVVYELESRVHQIQQSNEDSRQPSELEQEKGSDNKKSDQQKSQPAGSSQPQGKSSRGGADGRNEASEIRLLAVSHEGEADQRSVAQRNEVLS